MISDDMSQLPVKGNKISGALVPSAPEVEKIVLGGMLIDSTAVSKGVQLLKKSSFANNLHRLIFEAIVNLFDNNSEVDPITVNAEIKRLNSSKDDHLTYIAELAMDVGSAANFEYYARILLEKSILRDLIATCTEIISHARQEKDDALSILDKAEGKIFEITEAHMKKSFFDLKSVVQDTMELIDALHTKDYKKFALPTGYYQLDEMLGGFQQSDLIILAARPSMGKTALALSLARNIAVMNQAPIGFFSLEMSKEQLVMRLLCAEAYINAHDVRTGRLALEESKKLASAAARLSQAPMLIDDAPAQTVLEIRAKARRLKVEKNISMIMIDYLQLMQGPGNSESREREISHISRSLKALAKELKIPVLALAQLNRAVEQRQDKIPLLSDLRESGSIEQDADVVMFIHRPEYYGIKEDKDKNPTQGTADIIIAKHRNGPTGEVKLRFIKEFTRFENLEQFRSYENPAQIKPTNQDLPF